jgi:hypothetical protein
MTPLSSLLLSPVCVLRVCMYVVFCAVCVLSNIRGGIFQYNILHPFGDWASDPCKFRIDLTARFRINYPRQYSIVFNLVI